ncbi:hypothetical protein [Streptomyces wedmorensis]|uniref:hypothetical protein n=1 Tax=Streptomyces wedmorensis TaxID=43759 RepID=UPI0037A71A42
MAQQQRPQKTDFTERHALAIVNQTLGTFAYELDDGSRDGMCDALLALLDSGTPVAALEITLNADEAHAEMLDRLNRIDAKVLNGLACGWMVRYRSGARVAGTRREELRKVLIDLETRGVGRLDIEPEWPEDYDPMTGLVKASFLEDTAVLRRLGVEAVKAVGHGYNIAGKIFSTSIATGVGRADADPIPGYVNSYLLTKQGQNKVAKLQQSGLPPQRHLFVWVDGRHVPIWIVLREGWLPQRDPELPKAIDNLWLASPMASTALRWTRGVGWFTSRIPESRAPQGSDLA